MSRLWVFVAVVAALLVTASPAQAAAPANTVAPTISGPRDPGNPSEGDLLTAQKRSTVSIKVTNGHLELSVHANGRTKALPFAAAVIGSAFPVLQP